MIGIVVLSWLLFGLISIPIAGEKFGITWPPALHLSGGPIILIAILLSKAK